MTHFTVKLRPDWTFELPEEARRFAKPGQLVDIALEVALNSDAATANQSASLADYLGDFIGGIEGSGANNSDDTGSKFAEHVAAKHREGHL